MQSPRASAQSQLLFNNNVDLLRYLAPPTDIESFFSSPATEIDDPIIANTSTPSTPQFSHDLYNPFIPLNQIVSKPSSSFIPLNSLLPDSLTSIYNPTQLPYTDPSQLTLPPSAKSQLLHHQSLSLPPPPHHLSAHSPQFRSPSPCPNQPSPCASPCASPSPSQSESKPSRSNKRKRPLSALRAAAHHNAPDVVLTDPELQAIAQMHESDLDLAQSKQIYFTLHHFNQLLSRYNYRIKSIHLEHGADQKPFDFIIANNPPPSATSPHQSPHPTPTTPTTPSAVDHMLPPPSKRPRYSSSDPENTSSTTERLSCVVCRKNVSDLDTIIRHFRHSHQDLKPYSCPRCGGFYASENTLWTHISNVHTETPRKFKCTHCDASYDSFGAKTRHEHATHTPSKMPYVCMFEDCNLEFKFPAHLENHAARAHPGFRPFTCDADSCLKDFPSLNGLTRHRREVHDRVLVYRCSCGKTHPKRCHLKRHLLNVHKMSPERVKQEMDKQPHPGLLHIVPPGPPAAFQ